MSDRTAHYFPLDCRCSFFVIEGIKGFLSWISANGHTVVDPFLPPGRRGAEKWRYDAALRGK